jgi:hypothetical protein
MLDAQVVVDLLLKLVVRHDDSFVKGLCQKGSSFAHPTLLLAHAAAIARAGDFLMLLWGLFVLLLPR